MHLNGCNNSFIPPLSERVILANYSKKIFLNAERFEAVFQDNLVGLLACYLVPSREHNNEVFITNISIVKDFENQGIASTLMREMFSFCKSSGVTLVRLKVSNQSRKAHHFYQKHNFVCIGMDENDQSNLVLERKI